MFSFKKKKLTLREIHEVYLLLEHAIPETEEEFLILEIAKMMERVSPNTFEKVMRVMYNKRKLVKKTSSEIAIMFIKGLKDCDFFSYVHFIKSIHER